MNLEEKVMALEELRSRLKRQYVGFDQEKVQIGDFTYGFPVVRSWGEKNARLKIGKFCSIGGNVQIYLGGNHHTDWQTTYPFNVLLKDQFPGIDGGVAATKGDVTIGNDVWIASNVTILSGVTIGDGSVIAAGSVVTKDVFPCSLMAGNPAERKAVLWQKGAACALCWWDWPLEKLAEAIPILMSRESSALKMFEVNWK